MNYCCSFKAAIFGVMTWVTTQKKRDRICCRDSQISSATKTRQIVFELLVRFSYYPMRCSGLRLLRIQKNQSRKGQPAPHALRPSLQLYKVCAAILYLLVDRRLRHLQH